MALPLPGQPLPVTLEQMREYLRWVQDQPAHLFNAAHLFHEFPIFKDFNPRPRLDDKVTFRFRVKDAD